MSEINILAIFYSFSCGASWLLGILLLIGIDRTNIVSSRWLGIFYIILGCSFAQLFLEEFSVEVEFVIHLLELPRWAMFPCLYMAVSYYTSLAQQRKDALIHFVPFLLFLLYSLVYMMPKIFNEQVHLPALPRWVGLIVQYFFSVQMVFYWILCFAVLRKHQKTLKMLSSFTEKVDLEWLRYLLNSILILIIIRVLILLNLPITRYSPILYFLGIILLAYSTLTQKSIYAIEENLSPLQDNGEHKKSINERLTSEQVEEIKEIVIKKTMSQKLYLDPYLTLSALSQKIGIGNHELSYVLNNGIGKSFYQFINELRTEEAKLLLLSEETKHLDILGVAHRAGFNSKTTFYTIFKKATNLTPREYIKMKSNAGDQ